MISFLSTCKQIHCRAFFFFFFLRINTEIIDLNSKSIVCPSPAIKYLTSMGIIMEDIWFTKTTDKENILWFDSEPDEEQITYALRLGVSVFKQIVTFFNDFIPTLIGYLSTAELCYYYLDLLFHCKIVLHWHYG